MGFSSETHAKIMNHRGYRTDYQSWRQGKAQGAKGEPTSERLLDSLGIDARPLKKNGAEAMSKGWPQTQVYERTEPSNGLDSEVRGVLRRRRECSWSDERALRARAMHSPQGTAHIAAKLSAEECIDRVSQWGLRPKCAGKPRQKRRLASSDTGITGRAAVRQRRERVLAAHVQCIAARDGVRAARRCRARCARAPQLLLLSHGARMASRYARMGWGEEPEGNRRPLPISELMCAAMEATMERRLAAAHAKGCVLRYVGVINLDGTTSLGLREVELDHPYANLRGPELCIRFFSTRCVRAACCARARGC